MTHCPRLSFPVRPRWQYRMSGPPESPRSRMGQASDETVLSPRSLHSSDRQNVVYAAAAAGVAMPRSWKRACMPMRRVS
jgi:hypothetical protein